MILHMKEVIKKTYDNEFIQYINMFDIIKKYLSQEKKRLLNVTMNDEGSVGFYKRLMAENKSLPY